MLQTEASSLISKLNICIPGPTTQHTSPAGRGLDRQSSRSYRIKQVHFLCTVEVWLKSPRAPFTPCNGRTLGSDYYTSWHPPATQQSQECFLLHVVIFLHILFPLICNEKPTTEWLQESNSKHEMGHGAEVVSFLVFQLSFPASCIGDIDAQKTPVILLCLSAPITRLYVQDGLSQSYLTTYSG